jgi:phage gp36-like protein
MAYCTRADINGLFGAENVDSWADLDNRGNATTMKARVDAAIEYADAEIDGYLRGGPYAIPFATTPTLIRLASCRLAGVWLYESRRITDTPDEGETERVSFHREQAERTLERVRRGDIRLNLTEYTAVPKAVEDED